MGYSLAQTPIVVESPEWLSIGPACRLLGVNPATLRQWTSSGRLRVYRTPGGHRRFSATEIADLCRTPPVEPREATCEAIIEQLRTRYRSLAHSPSAHQGWMAGIDAETRLRFHELGDELLRQLGSYLSTSSPKIRQRALASARSSGGRYGTIAREVGVQTSQSVEAYLVFRRPLLDVLARSVSSHPELSDQLGRIMRDAERFMDEVLIGVTGAGADDASTKMALR
ncbi:MAG: binding domain protein, excisionase family [Chloroflexi bacterium]|nr:binding domain protein, excisionase family [Chloroflexota bacterium]